MNDIPQTMSDAIQYNERTVTGASLIVQIDNENFWDFEAIKCETFQIYITIIH